MATSLIRIDPRDNVAVAAADAPAALPCRAGDATIVTAGPVARGHKVALCAIPKGAEVIKYGRPIGRAVQDIAPGEWVHTHNLATCLSGPVDYVYEPVARAHLPAAGPARVQVYRRPGGRVGVRNEVWIIPTVACVNPLARRLAAELAEAPLPDGIDGVQALCHPYGCSQMGDDHERTRQVLAGLVRHPNAGGVLVVGLGCENNQVGQFERLVGQTGGGRVEYMIAQEEEDEVEAGRRCLRRLVDRARRARRVDRPAGCLRVGLKCGASDALSGVTANPLVGEFTDRLVGMGGTAVLTEVPEMFGAETDLLNRCVDRDVFERAARMINDCKQSYLARGLPVCENPSPGNRAGGITTLEEKSLGCIRKGGSAPVADVLAYGQVLRKPGLALLSGPGNDPVSVTALAAAGVHLVVFTTGRGTPLGACVPTVKVSAGSQLARRKPSWIDFDAGALLAGRSRDDLAAELFDCVLRVASGEQTRSEANDFRQIAILKDGPTL